MYADQKDKRDGMERIKKGEQSCRTYSCSKEENMWRTCEKLERENVKGEESVVTGEEPPFRDDSFTATYIIVN